MSDKIYQVLFICTANDLGNLSAPLRDRLEPLARDGNLDIEDVDTMLAAETDRWAKVIKEAGLKLE